MSLELVSQDITTTVPMMFIARGQLQWCFNRVSWQGGRLQGLGQGRGMAFLRRILSPAKRARAMSASALTRSAGAQSVSFQQGGLPIPFEQPFIFVMVPSDWDEMLPVEAAATASSWTRRALFTMQNILAFKMPISTLCEISPVPSRMKFGLRTQD